MSASFKYTIFLVLIGLGIVFYYQPTAAQQNGRQQLYVCMENLTPASLALLQQNKVPIIKIIYQNFIDPDNDNRVDTDVLRKRITALFPNANDGGYGVIDWEAKGFFDKLPANDPGFGQLANEYRTAIRTAKKLRPNVKWGFYGLPFRKYMSYNNEWRQRNMSVAPILKEADFIAPSLYAFFPDSLREKDNKDYVEQNVSMALQIGKQLNKPVLPFVWNRWHDGNKQYGLKLIPVDEFQRLIQRILSVDYSGQKVAGVIWWGADQYFYSKKAPAVVNEQARFSSFNAYQSNTINSYAQALLNVFKQQ